MFERRWSWAAPQDLLFPCKIVTPFKSHGDYKCLRDAGLGRHSRTYYFHAKSSHDSKAIEITSVWETQILDGFPGFIISMPNRHTIRKSQKLQVFEKRWSCTAFQDLLFLCQIVRLFKSKWNYKCLRDADLGRPSRTYYFHACHIIQKL